MYMPHLLEQIKAVEILVKQTIRTEVVPVM